jgi:hypothetical protein
MRRLFGIIPFLLLLAASCSSGSSDGSGAGAGAEELKLRTRTTGAISSVGDVKWYHFRAVETNRVLQVRCTSDTLRPDVDLLVTVYQQNSQGERSVIYGCHAPEEAMSPADLTLNAFIDVPKDIYVAVRDFKDDEAATDERYYLTLDYAGSADGDDSFGQATTLSPGADSCLVNSIGYVLDTDCYRFTSTGGIYDVAVAFDAFPGTQVQLQVMLYDANGTLLESQTGAGVKNFHLVHHLSAGEYYVLVGDYGKDHFDNASTYQVCIHPQSSTESFENDTLGQASPADLIDYGDTLVINGSLDYREDRDYYEVTTPLFPDGFKVLSVEFSAAGTGTYQVSLVDVDSVPLMTHTYSAGSAPYATQVRIEEDCFLLVQPVPGERFGQSLPYRVTLTVHDVEDDADMAPGGNDTIQTAEPITPTANPSLATLGKVSFRGDADWYAVTVPAHDRPLVLEVYLQAPVSPVEYTVGIMETRLLKTLTNRNAATAPTNLKTSLIVQPSTAQAVYSIKVSDYQDDEGADVAYALRVDLKDIPDTLPALSAGAPPHGATVQYFNEASSAVQGSITLEYNSVLRRTFGADTTMLDFARAVVQTGTPAPGLTTLTFPWTAGYVDYQGDQDWYMIDIQPQDDSEDWYYEIFVDIYAAASDVEYIWKFYPDRNDNAVLADRTSGYDGFIASAGDLTTAADTLSTRTPSAGQGMFWVGDPWQGPAYFSISDFNYLLDAGGNENTEPDEDWGAYGTAPYYFRVTLIYHPGVSYPEP